MKTNFAKLAGTAALGLLITGCINHSETVVRDVERLPIQFENDTAARIFYETLNKDGGRRSQTESTTEVSLPIIFEHKQKSVAGPNAAFNDAVTLCDTNKDGKITEQEAHIFAEYGHKK
jgi:hypothetical protein